MYKGRGPFGFNLVRIRLQIYHAVVYYNNNNTSEINNNNTFSVAGTCEYGKETSGSIKCGEFFG
jgi:hypothetical protein